MLTIFNALRGMDTISVLAKMICAFFLGGVIGLERSYKNRPAGFRTHILVCVGACIASMTGLFLYLVLNLPADMSRIGGNVITGLGFIGGGTIVVTKKHMVKGLTTAAGLWTTGIIGLAIGAGFYEGAIIGSILGLLVETYFSTLRSKIQHAPEFKIAISYYHRNNLDEVLRYCKDEKMSITNLQIAGRRESDVAMYSALVTLRPDGETDRHELIGRIEKMEGVISAEEL